MSTAPECTACQKTADQARLEKCAVCFKHFCEEHVYNYSGRTFCSKHCAEYFFFADPDD